MNFFNIFRRKKKINELSVFEEFRFELKKEERERVESLKKDFKNQPFLIINPDTIWDSNYLKELKLVEKLFFKNEEL